MFCYRTKRVTAHIPNTGGPSILYRYGKCSAAILHVLRPAFPIQVGQVYPIGMANVLLPHYHTTRVTTRITHSSLFNLFLIYLMPSHPWRSCQDETGEWVSRCFKPSQSQRIISGLGETFRKIYKRERTKQAGTRPEENSEKAESCQESLWNEIQLKGP